MKLVHGRLSDSSIFQTIPYGTLPGTGVITLLTGTHGVHTTGTTITVIITTGSLNTTVTSTAMTIPGMTAGTISTTAIKGSTQEMSLLI